MTILNQWYASGGSDVMHVTLEITDGVVTHFLTGGFDDLVCVLEDSRAVTFTACGMSVSLPARSSDGLQDLRFALCNIDGSVSRFLRTALSSGRKITVTLRQFFHSNLSAPVSAPVRYYVKSGSVTATQAQITAGYFDLLSTGWPRNRYTLSKFPGLRWIS